LRTGYFQCFECFKTYQVIYNLWEKPPRICPCDKKTKDIKRIPEEDYDIGYRNMPKPKSYNYEKSEEED